MSFLVPDEVTVPRINGIGFRRNAEISIRHLHIQRRINQGIDGFRLFDEFPQGVHFSNCPLIPEWNEDTRFVLIGHSFGGTTIRLFSELLAHGDEKERRAVDE